MSASKEQIESHSVNISYEKKSMGSYSVKVSCKLTERVLFRQYILQKEQIDPTP